MAQSSTSMPASQAPTLLGCTASGGLVSTADKPSSLPRCLGLEHTDGVQAPSNPETVNHELPVAESLGTSPDEPSRGSWKAACATAVTEAVSGITVALAMVPEAVAFSLAAGLEPQIGIASAFILCLFTTILGGRPAMVSGATGSIAVLIGPILKEHGPEYLFYAVMLMGVIQVVAGILGIGNLVRLVPASVEIGFSNGLALVIGFSQLSSYKLPGIASSEEGHGPEAFKPFVDGVPWEAGAQGAFAAIITLIAFAISIGLPYLTKRVPSALTGIALGTAFEWVVVRLAFKSHTTLVGDIGSAGGSFPLPIWLQKQYTMPALSGEVFSTIYVLAIIMAVIGILESAMTLSLIDERTKTKGNVMQECIGQGVANVVCGLLGGMGGCAMLGQSMINISSGARGRLSTFSCSIFLLFILLVAYPAINILPVASLAGVMFNVVYQTFEWASLKLLMVSALPKRIRQHLRAEGSQYKKIRRTDALIIVVVTVVTLLKDLAVAVGCGVLLACLMHIYESDQMIDVSGNIVTDAEGTVHTKVYHVQGVLFFGNVSKFLELFDADNDPSQVRIVFESGYIADYSALEGLKKLGQRYRELGNMISLQLLHPGSSRIIEKAANLLVKELAIAPQEEKLLDQQRFRHHIEGYEQSFGSAASELELPEAQKSVVRRRSAVVLGDDLPLPLQ